MICAEYIWLDGNKPVQGLRSKTLILPSYGSQVTLSQFSPWLFDGSSTNQAEGSSSDLVLKPVQFFPDPIRGEGNYLVMCEVFEADGKTSHKSNTRHLLRKVLDEGADTYKPWIGFEQEYTLFDGSKPVGWPEQGTPGPQGPYYCGVGADRICGRDIAEDHIEACKIAGIYLSGINAEVMLGQWEFQIGYRKVEGEKVDPLSISDQLWVARWLLHRIAESYNVVVSLDNKPIKGDWNGAGMHTNFSTEEMREKGSGIKAIEKGIEKLSKKHKEHIAVYGDKVEERLTGLHETCSYKEFRSGNSDRGASIRIPAHVVNTGGGYFEDRRPGANADPYLISHRLLKTICF